DRRQRLPAKAERGDAKQIFLAADLTGCMGFECDENVFTRHALAIVRDRDPAASPLIELDDDPPGAGVERVLDQLLHDGRRPFDDLAGCDLPSDRIRKHLYLRT